MKKPRNRFEDRVARELGPDWAYEPMKLRYTTDHLYTPDFVHAETRTIRETKGYFPPEDRRKMKAVVAQNPDWRFIIVFTDPEKRISKTSKVTYAAWCDKNGIAWERGPSRETN